MASTASWLDTGDDTISPFLNTGAKKKKPIATTQLGPAAPNSDRAAWADMNARPGPYAAGASQEWAPVGNKQHPWQPQMIIPAWQGPAALPQASSAQLQAQADLAMERTLQQNPRGGGLTATGGWDARPAATRSQPIQSTYDMARQGLTRDSSGVMGTPDTDRAALFAKHVATVNAMNGVGQTAWNNPQRAMQTAKAQGAPITPAQADFNVAAATGKTPSWGQYIAMGGKPEGYAASPEGLAANVEASSGRIGIARRREIGRELMNPNITPERRKQLEDEDAQLRGGNTPAWNVEKTPADYIASITNKTDSAALTKAYDTDPLTPAAMAVIERLSAKYGIPRGTLTSGREVGSVQPSKPIIPVPYGSPSYAPPAWK